MRMAPTTMASTAAAARGSLDPAIASAVRIETVEVTLTLSAREVPSAA
jgi:hypothetical protein